MADYDRFRSFAERYLVARASNFRVGFEREDAWKATLDAKTIYGNIAKISAGVDEDILSGSAVQSAPSNSILTSGSTGTPNKSILRPGAINGKVAAQPATPTPAGSYMQTLANATRLFQRKGK